MAFAAELEEHPFDRAAGLERRTHGVRAADDELHGLTGAPPTPSAWSVLLHGDPVAAGEPISRLRISMGKILRRHLTHELVAGVLAGLGLFTFILLVARVLEVVDLVLARGVPPGLVLRLIGYILPSFLEIAIPMAVLLGLVTAFGRLSSDGEILAMRGAGLSLRQIAGPAFGLGIAAALLTFVVAGWARPWAHGRIEDTIFEIASTRATAALRPAVFNSLSDGIVLYADQIDADAGTLQGVLLSDERDGERRTTVLAGNAVIRSNAAARDVFLRLNAGTSLTQHATEDSYDVTAFDSFEVHLDLSRVLPASGAPSDRTPEKMYPSQLIGAIVKPVSGGRAEAETIELHRRLAFPVAALLLAILGVPLGLQPSRSVRARGLSTSLIVALAYYVLMSAAAGAARRNPAHAALAMWLPNLVLAVVACIAFARAANDRPAVSSFLSAAERLRALLPGTSPASS
jgi:lipopolysaccharide export system permease protein